jgi:hypothetical protein
MKNNWMFVAIVLYILLAYILLVELAKWFRAYCLQPGIVLIVAVATIAFVVVHPLIAVNPIFAFVIYIPFLLTVIPLIAVSYCFPAIGRRLWGPNY